MILKVLKPDTTYQVKVQAQCLSKVHSTNDFVTLRTPEGCKWYSSFCGMYKTLWAILRGFPKDAQHCRNIITGALYVQKYCG